MPSQGTYDPSTGQWSVGTVDLDIPETLVILARVDSPGTQTNTATISHSDQFDPNSANNTASATTTPQQGTSTSATVIVDANRVAVTSPVPLGTSVHDTATIGGQVSGLPATGTLTYEFFTTIDGTGTHTDEVVTLNPDGSVPDSALHGPLAAGAYSFVAVYSGDSNYVGSTSPVEPLTVQQGIPVLPPSVTSLERFGFHAQPTAFVLTFSSALDPRALKTRRTTR